MTTKAQVSQVFLFMAALIVLAAIVLLGAFLVRTFSSNSCEQARERFGQDMSALLEANKAYGSRRRVSISPPCDTIAICFVDAKSIGNAGFSSADSAINTAVKAGVPTTIFLQQKDGVTLPASDDERIILGAINDNTPVLTPLCINVSGSKVSMSLQGFGKQIRVMP